MKPEQNSVIKGLYIKTYGCQMNIYDSDKMATILKPHGFALVDQMQNSDMVILNTCHIREKAAEKVYSELGRVAKVKERKAAIGQKMIVVVAGCVAQAEGKEVVKRAPIVDIIVGPQSYHNLPVLLEEVKRKNSWVLSLDFTENAKFDSLAPAIDNQKASAFLSIQEGCDKFCHFCCVPYTRGAEFSRPASSIYREALTLATNGAKEITLLGQNVSAYHGEGIINKGETISLGNLIEIISRIEQIKRISYTTSHPSDMNDEQNNALFHMHATENKLIPYLHLPVQSGSDKILKAMNRKHNVEFYLQVIEKFRKVRPDMAFSSDFIVGYPGETDADFTSTLDLIRKVNYAQAYSFMYSPRAGTPAAALPQIKDDVKSFRLQELQTLLRSQQLNFNRTKIGKTMEVLLDKRGKKPGQLVGKSPYMQSVICSGSDQLLHTIANVMIIDANQNSLVGEIVTTH